LVADAGEERPGGALAFLNVSEKLPLGNVRHGAEKRHWAKAGMDVDVAAIADACSE